MSKGIHVSTLIGLIIAVLILILFAPMLIRAAKAVWDQILQALGLVKPSALEKAVECAYYRCAEGCLSYKVTDEIEWEENGRIVKCNEFCNVPKEFRGTNDEICGWNALQYPVEIKVENDTEVGKKIDDINFDCITTDDSSWGFGSGAKDRTFIFINKNLLKNIKREKCEYPGVAGFLGFGIYNAIEKAQISANNNAFIHTYYGGPPIQGISGLVWGGTTTTQVDNETPYIILEPQKPVNIIFLDEKLKAPIHRVVAGGNEYTFTADIMCEEYYREGAEPGINDGYCKEPFWVVVSAKSIKDGKTESTWFYSDETGKVRSLFNFVLSLNELHYDWETGIGTPPYVWGYTNFTITYYPEGIPAGVVPPKVKCSDFTNPSDCTDAGCWWCRKCEGYYVNQWKADKCVDPQVDCGYVCGDRFTPPECDAGRCDLGYQWSPWECICTMYKD